jgi:hypothetical protein
MKSHKSELSYSKSFSNCFAPFAGTLACFAVNKEPYKYLKIYFFILIFTLRVVNSSGQNENLTQIIASIAEELADNETDPEAVALFIEKLHDLNEKPVQLNSADETELSRLFFLTDFQIKALVDYIHSSGNIYSVYEIANIPGFNRELVETIIPFISVDKEKSITTDSFRLRQNLITSFSVKFPRSDTSLIGPAFKLLTRYKFTAGGFSGNLTAEKDNGEKLFNGKPPLPDFLTASIAWTGNGIIRKIIIGDFGAQFGLGTNINTSLRTGLSLTASGYLSGGEEIRSYTSTDENNFFRGIAARLQLKRIGLSAFYSLNKIDGTLVPSDVSSDLYVASFYRSGLHDSPASASRKDVVAEASYGLNLTYNFRNSRIGILWSEKRFSLPVQLTSQDPEDNYSFVGNRNSTLSAYYKAAFDKMVFYSEVSANPDKRLAYIQGVSFRPADRLNINLLYRNYDPGFTSFHGSGPFSSSTGDNVRGIFGNFTFEAARHLFISAGCDLRYYPWVKYRCSAPSMAKSREVRIKYLPSAKITVEAAYNYRYVMLNAQDIYGTEKQENAVSNTFKGTINYLHSDNLTIGIRLDCKVTNLSGSRGWLLLQDIKYRFGKIPVSVWFRYCIFKTDDWSSRLYTYENDLLYSFSIPALSGEGYRSYIMVSFKARKFIDLRIKYAITDLISSGESKANEELRMQIRLWF